MKRLVSAALGTAMLAMVVSAAGQTLRIGSVTNSRFNQSWTLDGPQMANTRAKLLNTANFGPGGTDTKANQITDTGGTVGSIDAALLSNFDVFFIGWFNDPNVNAFTPAELSAMQAWVNGGGTMIITCDDDTHDAVCSSFGHPATSGSPGINPIVPTAAGASHPLFNGPFGVVTAINEVGTQGGFTNTAGATVLAQDSTAGTPLPVVLVQQIGAGRAVFMADVDLIANGLSAGATITNQNDRFLGNLFAFVGGFAAAPAPSTLAPVPTLSSGMLAILAIVIAAMAFGMRRGFARR